MTLQELEQIAGDLTSDPDGVFKDLHRTGHEARLRGHYTRAEFLAICRWKSPRSSPLCRLNTDAQVRTFTGKAFATQCERERMQALVSLTGVAVPSASALLAASDPTTFGVIDIRAWKLLHGAEAVKHNQSGRCLSINNWLQYLPIIQRIAKKVGTTPRLVELSLYKAHKSSASDYTLYGQTPRSSAKWHRRDSDCR